MINENINVNIATPIILKTINYINNNDFDSAILFLKDVPKIDPNEAMSNPSYEILFAQFISGHELRRDIEINIINTVYHYFIQGRTVRDCHLEVMRIVRQRLSEVGLL